MNLTRKIRTHKLSHCHAHRWIWRNVIPVFEHHIALAKMSTSPSFPMEIWHKNESVRWILCRNSSIQIYLYICTSNFGILALLFYSFCICSRRQSKWYRSNDAVSINITEWKHFYDQFNFNSVVIVVYLPDLPYLVPFVCYNSEFRFDPLQTHFFW